MKKHPLDSGQFFPDGFKGIILYRLADETHIKGKALSILPKLHGAQMGVLEALEPDRLYEYKIFAVPEGADDTPLWDELPSISVFSFKTFPHISSSTTFIFGSCRHYGYTDNRQGDKAFRNIVEGKLHSSDFLLMCGDQIYADHKTSKFGFIPPWKLNKPPKGSDG